MCAKPGHFLDALLAPLQEVLCDQMQSSTDNRDGLKRSPGNSPIETIASAATAWSKTSSQTEATGTVLTVGTHYHIPASSPQDFTSHSEWGGGIVSERCRKDNNILGIFMNARP